MSQSDFALLAYQIGELQKSLEKHAEATKASLKEISAKIERQDDELDDHASRLNTIERFSKWGAGLFTGIVSLVLKREFHL